MSESSEALVQYRPRRSTGVIFSAVFLATAAVLIWIGAVLDGNAAEAMDGFTRLLFTLVSIRWFTWIFAGVFAFFGVVLGRKALRREPTLTLSTDGLRIGAGALVPWSQIEGAEVLSQGLLNVRTRTGASGRLLSSFDLGGDPQAAAMEIEARRSAAAETE